MKRIAATLACLLMLAATEPPSIDALSRQARAAREAGDHSTYLRRVEEIAARLPGQPSVSYSLARAYALTGRAADAIALLGRLADAGWGFEAAADPAFASLRDLPAFASVRDRFAANAAPRGDVTVRTRLGLVGRQPEGVAATADGTLYLGALRDGVYRVEADGLRRLYRPDEGWGVVGLRVDAARRELVACVSDETAGKGRLVRLALPDLELRDRVDLDAERVFCNDSARLPDGRFAVTDSTGGRLWLVTGDAAEPLELDRPLAYPNGVAFGGGRLYVAHANGLLVVDPATGSTREVGGGRTALIGIDGLIWHEGRLLAVQNGTQPIRVLRIEPAARDGADAKVEVLASGHPLLNGATTAAVADGRLVVMTQTGIPAGSLPDDPLLVSIPL